MKKRILNEQSTRKFMKLAGLQPLSENFFSSTLDEEEELDLEDEEGALPPEGLEDEEPMGELPPEEPMEVGDDGGVDVHSLVDAIASAIEQETGVTVDVEGSEGDLGAPDEEELPMDDEADLEAPADDLGDELPDEEVPLDEATEEVTEDTVDEELESAGISLDETTDEAFLNEVTRRVATRILGMSKKNK